MKNLRAFESFDDSVQDLEVIRDLLKAEFLHDKVADFEVLSQKVVDDNTESAIEQAVGGEDKYAEAEINTDYKVRRGRNGFDVSIFAVHHYDIKYETTKPSIDRSQPGSSDHEDTLRAIEIKGASVDGTEAEFDEPTKLLADRVFKLKY